MEIKTPCMHENEIKLFSSCILNSNELLEFGCGGSTIHALNKNINIRITSVETDSAYIEKMKNNINNNQLLKGRCKLIHANIGEVKDWGNPVNRDDMLKWLNYTVNLWPKFSECFDSVFIDGRFRLATSLFALIYIPNALHIFHDFTVRSHYSPLLKYIDVQEVEHTLIVYRRKTGIKCSQILAEASKHLFDYR